MRGLTCTQDLLGALVAVRGRTVGRAHAAVRAGDIPLRPAVVAQRWPRTPHPLVAPHAVGHGSFALRAFVGTESLSEIGVHLCSILPFLCVRASTMSAYQSIFITMAVASSWWAR